MLFKYFFVVDGYYEITYKLRNRKKKDRLYFVV